MHSRELCSPINIHVVIGAFCMTVAPYQDQRLIEQWGNRQSWLKTWCVHDCKVQNSDTNLMHETVWKCDMGANSKSGLHFAKCDKCLQQYRIPKAKLCADRDQ